MHATASITSSVTPKRPELSRFSARVTTDGAAEAVGAFGTATWGFVSSIADIVVCCVVQNGHDRKGTGRMRQDTEQVAPRIITNAGGDGNSIPPCPRRPAAFRSASLYIRAPSCVAPAELAHSFPRRRISTLPPATLKCKAVCYHSAAIRAARNTVRCGCRRVNYRRK